MNQIKLHYRHMIRNSSHGDHGDSPQYRKIIIIDLFADLKESHIHTIDKPVYFNLRKFIHTCELTS